MPNVLGEALEKVAFEDEADLQQLYNRKNEKYIFLN